MIDWVPWRVIVPTMARLGSLVSIAMVYGDAAGTVTVTSTVLGDQACLTVHNTGAVIPPAIITTMFEPMVRGGTQDQSNRSVGLGLFIVKAIATAHGGAVAVACSLGNGTTFSFTFPTGQGR